MGCEGFGRENSIAKVRPRETLAADWLNALALAAATYSMLSGRCEMKAGACALMANRYGSGFGRQPRRRGQRTRRSRLRNATTSHQSRSV